MWIEQDHAVNAYPARWAYDLLYPTRRAPLEVSKHRQLRSRTV